MEQLDGTLEDPNGIPASPEPDEEYVSIEQRRLVLFALRSVGPHAVIAALIFATISYFLLVSGSERSSSWFEVDVDSIVRLYLPSSFVFPLLLTPFILRRTLQMRIAGKLQPPLDATLDELPWVQWSVILGLIAGGVWAALVLTVLSILSSWAPNAELGVWEGFAFKIVFTVVIGLSVAVVCALAAVRIGPDSDLIERVLSSDGDEEPTPAEAIAATLPATGEAARRGRLEVPVRTSAGFNWNRWRVGVRPEILRRTEDVVYISKAQRYAFIRRGLILISASVLLASFALYTNSAAVVVAAMFISPLMTPILGLTVALVTGHPSRQIESALVVVGASGYAVLITWIAGLLMPNPAVLPTVLLDYTDPRLADLMIALVAGAVGAYILVHTEASTALPGVVVSLSLEPPLAAVGLTLAWGFGDLASDAFLMFIMNLAAIVGAGSVVLILSGFLPVNDLGRLPRRIRVGLVTATLAILVVSYPLYRASSDAWNETSDLESVGAVVIPWAADADFEVTDIQVEDELVTIDLSGTEEPPSVEQLVADVESALDRQVEVHVRVFPYTLYEEPTGP